MQGPMQYLLYDNNVKHIYCLALSFAYMLYYIIHIVV
jgi:hypothetical protein